MHSGRALASVTVTARQGDRLAHESSYAGHGRTYGRGSVFTEDGRLVASFVQDNLVRSLRPEARTSGAASMTL